MGVPSVKNIVIAGDWSIIFEEANDAINVTNAPTITVSERVILYQFLFDLLAPQ